MVPTLLKEYINYVNNNPKLVCIKTQQAVARIEKLCEQMQTDKSIVFDDKEPKSIIAFCENLSINLRGDKLKLLPWQKFFISTTFGFYRKDKKVLRRMFNDVFLFIAKKNGKSSLIAALALYYLITQDNAQIIITACDYSQAKISFGYMCDFINFTPELKEALKSDILFVRESPPLTIVDKELYSKIIIVPETRAKQAQGFKPTVVIADEISSYRTSEILQKLSSGQVDQNSIMFKMTTGETNMNNPGLFEYSRAKQVLAGKFDADNYFPLVYELDEGDDWHDENKYIKANPSIDITKPLKKMIEDREKAIQNPVDLPSFKAYHLNLWLSSSAQGIKDENWHKIRENYEKYKQYLTEDKLETYQCYGAIDLSKIDDYTAYTKYFYIPEIKKYYAIHHFYIPKGQVLSRLKQESEQILNWVNSGYITLTITDGTEDLTINYDYLKQDILNDAKKYKMIGIGYDPYHASKFIEGLEDENKKLIYSPFSMGWKTIAPANKDWLQDVYEEKIIDNNPVMDWMRSCAKFEIDRNNNILFVKTKYFQSNERIDGVDTSVMAHSLMKAQIEVKVFDEEEFNKVIDNIDY